MLALEAIVAIGLAIVVGAVIAPRLRVPLPSSSRPSACCSGSSPRSATSSCRPRRCCCSSSRRSCSGRASPRRSARAAATSASSSSTAPCWSSSRRSPSPASGTWFGMPWVVALVMGAALAPDRCHGRRQLAGSLPLRQRTVLRAESLINDGTALVIYASPSASRSEPRSSRPLTVTWELVVSYVGGVAIGLAVGLLGSTAPHPDHRWRAMSA